MRSAMSPRSGAWLAEQSPTPRRHQPRAVGRPAGEEEEGSVRRRLDEPRSRPAPQAQAGTHALDAAAPGQQQRPLCVGERTKYEGIT